MNLQQHLKPERFCCVYAGEKSDEQNSHCIISRCTAAGRALQINDKYLLGLSEWRPAGDVCIHALHPKVYVLSS